MASGISTCCCCSLRAGVIVGVCVITILALNLFSILIMFYNENMVRFVPGLQESLIYWAPQLVWTTSGLCVIFGIIAVNMSREKGRIKAIFAYLFGIMCLIVAVSWCVYGINFALELKGFTNRLLPGTWFLERAQKKQGAERERAQNLATTMAVAGNPAAVYLAYLILPYPLDLAFWLGFNYSVPLVLLGVVPVIVIAPFSIAGFGLGSVAWAGGDGTEKQPGKNIEWYYSLSDMERAKVDSGDYDISSDEDGDDGIEEGELVD